ncbi:CLUMA_CG013357, isoform A [Clunio marinus]|uniref:CLUMA_CG013357, isoform A n=1 Tax=Clunio marinus TaxID=568069 RepID=A0A1J1IJZ4_9DIPT|nr:CLUMA_CG013357, isoform A [Clunio marinus]
MQADLCKMLNIHLRCVPFVIILMQNSQDRNNFMSDDETHASEERFSISPDQILRTQMRDPF